MPRITSTIEERLARAQLAIDNALADASLTEALATFGYDAERLAQGQALRESAWALYRRQRGEYGDLYTAGDALGAAQRQAQDSYMKHVKAARVALKGERGALQKLDLATQRKRALAGWLAQAQQFYANALADQAILGKLARFGITGPVLEAGRRQVGAVAASLAERQRRKGAAQEATGARDAALAALDAWMSDFLKIARVALEEQPQLLEKLGVAAPARRGATRASTPAPLPPAILSLDGEQAAPLPPIGQPQAERRNGRPAVNGRA